MAIQSRFGGGRAARKQQNVSPFAGASGHNPVDANDPFFPGNGAWRCKVRAWTVFQPFGSPGKALIVNFDVLETLEGQECKKGKYYKSLVITELNKARVWGEINMLLSALFDGDEGVIEVSEPILDAITDDPSGVVGCELIVVGQNTTGKEIDEETKQPKVFTNLFFYPVEGHSNAERMDPYAAVVLGNPEGQAG